MAHGGPQNITKDQENSVEPPTGFEPASPMNVSLISCVLKVDQVFSNHVHRPQGHRRVDIGGYPTFPGFSTGPCVSTTTFVLSYLLRPVHHRQFLFGVSPPAYQVAAVAGSNLKELG